MKISFRSFILLFMLVLIDKVNAQSQKNVRVNIELTPFFEKLILHLHSKTDSITNCLVQIKDAKQEIVKTKELPRAYKHLEYKLDIIDLLPGKYTCEVLFGTTSIFHKDFNKDAILSEPQTQPVIRKE
jgi:hypothetical protein